MKISQNVVNIFIAVILAGVVAYLGITASNKNSSEETISDEQTDSNSEYVCLVSPTVGMTNMDYSVKEEYINDGYKYVGLVYYDNCGGQAMLFQKEN